MKRFPVVVVLIVGVVLLLSSCLTGGASWMDFGARIPDWELTPTYGTVVLDAGFRPDPNLTSVVAGGGVDLDSLSG